VCPHGISTLIRKNIKLKATSGVLIVSIILLLSCVLACSPSPQSEGNSANSHFSANGVSFDYPKTWEKISSSSDHSVVSLVNSENTSVSVDIEKNNLPAGRTLDNINAELIYQMGVLMMLKTASTTVAGVSARDTNFLTNDYQIRFICLVKNEMVYAILCTTPPDIFDQSQQGFSMIIDSLKIK
jgi:hypothetical protein